MSNEERVAHDAAQLIQAAARLVSAAVDGADHVTLQAIEAALNGGAFPLVEVVPHPSAPTIRIWLAEYEGQARHLLATVPIRETRPCAH
ncbi:MAG TPA: hypothetical protein PKZ76_18775 [Xanthomonadaceae bacterium]|nr:hypothetical protein [Xanthomonadaceae bacterium]